jgi:hypothetical protein
MLVYDHARLLAAENLLRKVALVGLHSDLKTRLADAIRLISELTGEVAEDLADRAELRRIAAEEGAAAALAEPQTLAGAIDRLAEGLDAMTRVEAVVALTRKVTDCNETVDLVREALAPWEEEQA